jgi:hypothetical protein
MKTVFAKAEKIVWTKHCQEKMRYYGLSEQRVKRVLRNPERKEEGIAPGTVALMQSSGSRKHPTEIWLMYQRVGETIKIITAWRYPGKSPLGKPIPDEIMEELRQENVLTQTFLIKVRVVPEANKEEIIERGKYSFEVKIKEKPIKGQANKRVQEILAHYFQVPENKIKLIKGFRQRNKIFEIRN